MSAGRGPGGRALVWDFGGVVFRWRPAELLRTTLPQRATSDADAAHWVVEFFQGYRGDWGEFDRGAIGVPELAQRIAARTGLSADEVRAVVQGVPQELQPQPATVALIEQLHAAGMPQYYLSNMPAPYAALLSTMQPVLRRFASGVFSSDVRLVKPDPAIYALAAERFGRAPAQLLFIDDHPANVEAARAAGWHGIHFRGAGQVREELRAVGWFA